MALEDRLECGRLVVDLEDHAVVTAHEHLLHTRISGPVGRGVRTLLVQAQEGAVARLVVQHHRLARQVPFLDALEPDILTPA